jgi:ABC-type multidrug transport system ATPase subunit/multidrug efflux pump subunit AcrB
MTISRSVIAVAIVLFAIVSAPRIPLELAPALSLPELTVSLQVPADGSGDPIETTRRWLLPVESAVRTLGDVAGTRAEVGADSATLVIRFRGGTDVELKAARLASELASVRARLPRDASIAVWPATAGARSSALVALTGTAAATNAERAAEELRSATGVRTVDVFGGNQREAVVRMHPFAAISANEVRGAIAESLSPRAIGITRRGAREAIVISAASATTLRDVPLRAGDKVIPLGAVATIAERNALPDRAARLNGKPAVILAIERDHDISLFDFERSVREKLLPFGVEEVWSEAAELRVLLRRVVLALLIATLLLGAGGFVLARMRGLLLAMYVPLAAALVINLYRLTAIDVDALAILAALLAIVATSALAATRIVSIKHERWPLVISALFVLLLPIAIALASGLLAPFLAAPARAFAIASLGSIAAAWLMPSNATRSRTTSSKPVMRALRGAASVALAATTIAALLFSYFGQQLDPHRSEGAAERTRLFVRLTLPAGTPLTQTITNVERVEKAIGTFDGVDRFFSFVTPAHANFVIDLEPEKQRADKMRRFRTELRARMPLPAGVVTVSEQFASAGGGRFSEDGEDRPRADEDGHFYRFLLKGTDAEALRRAHEDVVLRLGRMNIRRDSVEAEWPGATSVVELVPRPSTTPELAGEAAAAIAARTLPPRERRLPDGTTLLVAQHDAPRTYDEVPPRDEVFNTPLRFGGTERTLASAFVSRQALVAGNVTRELGRYVLPVTVWVPGFELLEKRKEIDRVVAATVLPAGTVVDRPSLESWTFSRAKLRLAGLAAFLPLLLFATAAVILSSLRQALVAMTPAVFGLAFAAPLLRLVSAEVDEITLVVLAAVMCCGVAGAVAMLLRAHGLGVAAADSAAERRRVAGAHTAAAAAAYRATRRFAPALVLAAIVAAITLIVASTAATTLGDSWRGPLIAAATSLTASLAAVAIVPVALSLLLRDLSRRRSPEAKALSHPAEWREDAPAHLAVRSISKRYASAFRALRQVSFDLEPGIIGLLGPNGAGKTTLLRIITGLLLPTRGQVLYRGVPMTPDNIAAYRSQIGFLPQEFNAYTGLTAEQFLDYWALERGITDPAHRRREIERLLEVVDLTPHANRRVREFSGGMRQRIGIARALIGDPKLLVVDEPTTGLDIEARGRFRDLIVSLGRDRIIVLSTHIAGDIEETASRILLLERGTLRWDGTPAALIARAQGRVFETVVPETAVRALTRRYRVTTRVRVASGVRVRGVVTDGSPLPGPAAEPNLEEAYLAEVGGAAALRTGSFSFLFEESAC